MNRSEAVKELYFTMHTDHLGNFHVLLYQLIAKADMGNLERLRAGFPEAVKAWEDWQKSPDDLGFFENEGIETKRREQ